MHLIVERQFKHCPHAEGGQDRREGRKAEETKEATVDVQLSVRRGSDVIGSEEGKNGRLADRSGRRRC
jgi:hypothetical protein